MAIIALLEPDRFLGDILREILIEEGHDVVAPRAGDLAATIPSDQPVDLAVMESSLPTGGVTDRGPVGAPAAPVLFLGTLAPTVALPGMVFLRKPFDIDDLLTTITGMMARRGLTKRDQ